MVDRIIHNWLKIPYLLHMEVVQRPKRPKATFLLIHGLGSSSQVWNKISASFPGDVMVVTVDLLGFGKSPKPEWPEYDAIRQARSVILSYRMRRLPKDTIVVGHSMGSIVAVEIAKLKPRLVRSLILCSPPFYNLDGLRTSRLPQRERALLDIYRTINNHPERFAKVAAKAIKYKLIDESYRLETATLPSYTNALQAAIVNQTSMQDVMQLKQPISIIHGSLDPVVVRANLKYLAKSNSNITVTHVRAGHEITSNMAKVLIQKVTQSVKN